MRISDAELDYWGDVFCERGLARYMTFAAFINAPKRHLHRILGGEYRPLLIAQQKVRERMEKLGRFDVIERLEKSGELVPLPGKQPDPQPEPPVEPRPAAAQTLQRHVDVVRHRYLREARRLRRNGGDILASVSELERLADEHIALLQTRQRAAGGCHD